MTLNCGQPPYSRLGPVRAGNAEKIEAQVLFHPERFRERLDLRDAGVGLDQEIRTERVVGASGDRVGVAKTVPRFCRRVVDAGDPPRSPNIGGLVNS